MHRPPAYGPVEYWIIIQSGVLFSVRPGFEINMRMYVHTQEYITPDVLLDCH